MAKRDERKKASQIFNESNFVFASKASFEEVFPQIEDISIEVTESGEGVYGDGRRVYNKGQVGEFVDCSNPICYRGGVRVGSLLHKMVHEHQTELEDTVKCIGYEGSPKGRRVYRDCWNFFKIRIALKYKNEPTQADE